MPGASGGQSTWQMTVNHGKQVSRLHVSLAKFKNPMDIVSSAGAPATAEIVCQIFCASVRDDRGWVKEKQHARMMKPQSQLGVFIRNPEGFVEAAATEKYLAADGTIQAEGYDPFEAFVCRRGSRLGVFVREALQRPFPTLLKTPVDVPGEGFTAILGDLAGNRQAAVLGAGEMMAQVTGDQLLIGRRIVVEEEQNLSVGFSCSCIARRRLTAVLRMEDPAEWKIGLKIPRELLQRFVFAVGDDNHIKTAAGLANERPERTAKKAGSLPGGYNHAASQPGCGWTPFFRHQAAISVSFRCRGSAVKSPQSAR